MPPLAAVGCDPDHARAYSRWSQGAHRSPQWGESFSSDSGLEDLLSGLFGGRARGPARGVDAEGEITVDFLDAVRGGEVRVHAASHSCCQQRQNCVA